MSEAKFVKTFCSQCGREFGPGDSGFSACSEHGQHGARRLIAELLEALKEADWALAGMLKEAGIDQSHWNNPLPDSSLAKIRAAIAKAVQS